MSELEDAIASRLEAQSCILAKAVEKHVLLCFRSHDPQVSLMPVVQGPAEGVQEAAKLVVERFEHLLKMHRTPCFYLWRQHFCFVNKLCFCYVG
jgi:hypothetical protein